MKFFDSIQYDPIYFFQFEKFAVVVVVVGSRDHRLNPSPSAWTGLDWTWTRAWQYSNRLLWTIMNFKSSCNAAVYWYGKSTNDFIEKCLSFKYHYETKQNYKHITITIDIKEYYVKQGCQIEYNLWYYYGGWLIVICVNISHSFNSGFPSTIINKFLNSNSSPKNVCSFNNL